MKRDLREWIECVRTLGLLKDVKGADWNLEVGAITDLNVKAKKFTLLFDALKGYPEGFRILTGALLDAKRVALALGLAPTLTNLDLVKLLRGKVDSAIRTAGDYPVRYVDDAPLLENAQRGPQVDLLSLPTPKSRLSRDTPNRRATWPASAGRAPSREDTWW